MHGDPFWCTGWPQRGRRILAGASPTREQVTPKSHFTCSRNGGYPWTDRSALHMHNSILNTPLAGLSGRSLLSSLSALTAAGLIDAPFVAGALGSPRSLGRLAVQAPSAEGTWSAVKVEGAIPQELNGELYRSGERRGGKEGR